MSIEQKVYVILPYNDIVLDHHSCHLDFLNHTHMAYTQHLKNYIAQYHSFRKCLLQLLAYKHTDQKSDYRICFQWGCTYMAENK